jgi:predicted esterase
MIASGRRVAVMSAVVAGLLAGGSAVAKDLEDTLEGFVRLSPTPVVLEPEVDFMGEVPDIDGRLDDRLAELLPVREFTHYRKHHESNPVTEASYRVGYGPSFLYLYVEAEAESLTYRDRAYQFGDGFSMVIARPRPDGSPTEEFYVLACSAVDRQDREWSRRVFWYYNVDTIFTRASKEALLEFEERDGRISFELLLPWADVHPNHPWHYEAVGFNLSFIRAVGESRNEHIVVPDGVGAELMPRRYAILRFEPAPDSIPRVTHVLPARNHCFVGATVSATAASSGGGVGDEDVVVRVNSGEGDLVTWSRAQYRCGDTVTRHEFELDTAGLPPGGYTLEWYSRVNESRGESPLTVFPAFSSDERKQRVIGAPASVPEGARATMELEIEEIEESLRELHPYESSGSLRLRIERVEALVKRAEAGKDVYAERRGFFRRAFRSELDGTLQPYGIRIPDDFDPDRRYPLMVYLHGSASDETNLRGTTFLTGGGFIEVAPFGRGESSMYVSDESQTDIAEAIADVIENYPIDESRVVLAGFSMGGYGVLRTFYETPEKFRALVVFSGDPDLANRWSDSGSYPDFTNDEFVAGFDSVPVFVFHGEQDRNAPFERVVLAVEKLRAAGARVEFVTEPDRGHEAPGDETIEAYHAWLNAVLEDQ